MLELDSLHDVISGSLIDIVAQEGANASSTFAFSGSLSKLLEVYGYAARVYTKLDMYEEALHATERGRARLFLDLLTNHQLKLEDEEAAQLIRQEQETYKNLESAKRSLKQVLEIAPSEVRKIENLESDLINAEESYNNVVETIQSRDDGLTSLFPRRGNVLNLEAVQLLLDDETMLISYYVLDDFEDAGTMVFLLTKDKVVAFQLRNVTSGALKEQLGGVYGSFANTDIYDLESWQNLYTLLIKPVEQHIDEDIKNIGVIPHKEIHYVPFAGLADGETFLSDKYALFALPSITSLPLITSNYKEVIDTTSALVLSASRIAGLPVLNYASEEVEDIGRILNSVDRSGTERLFWEEANNATIIHLAAHAEYNESNPLDSKISLYTDDKDHDGDLQVRDLFNLDLENIAITTFSACETGLSQASWISEEMTPFLAGDEIVSFSRSLFYAGSPTVISTLWAVDDAASKELMVEFYRQWQDHSLNKVEAFKVAQKIIRQEHPHPFFWSGFVLSGYWK